MISDVLTTALEGFHEFLGDPTYACIYNGDVHADLIDIRDKIKTIRDDLIAKPAGSDVNLVKRINREIALEELQLQFENRTWHTINRRTKKPAELGITDLEAYARKRGIA